MPEEIPPRNSLAQARAASGGSLKPDAVREVIAAACPEADYRGQRALLIVPDGTRTAPIGMVFRELYRRIGSVTRAFDVMIALGTHPPLTDEAIRRRLEITETERRTEFESVRLFNHEWNNPAALRRVGVITADEIAELSGGLFSMDVPVEINKRVLDYDRIIIAGPVFPHEVVGFSGGNKYLFPGVAGPQLLDFFHWLGAVITTPRIVGNKWTPVRRVVDRAAAMVSTPKLCLAMVARPDKSLAGLFAGSPEDAWDAASELSRQIHIVYKDRPYHTILAAAPTMYEDNWTAGKAMYKLEPVLADGGELIIFAPHIREVSVTHGGTIRELGYHCRDYFLKQWDRFKDYPWGVLAHSVHVHGLGTYENGLETPRAHVTLATGIPPEVCAEINLGYRDPTSIRPEEYASRESEGVLFVPQAGEILHRLKKPPDWA
jgi:nickel-dependent lactate racemase